MAELVTIKTSESAGRMGLIKSYLEDNDIQCILQDEITSQMYPAVGGIKLQVVAEDAERAIKLLIEGGFAKEEDYRDAKTHPWVVKIVDAINNLFGAI